MTSKQLYFSTQQKCPFTKKTLKINILYPVTELVKRDPFSLRYGYPSTHL